MQAHPTSLIDALFGKTKKSIIGILFSNPDRRVHLRELARLADVSPMALSKEIRNLTSVGLVISEPDGNRVAFRANKESPIFNELCGIAKKTTGIVDRIRNALTNVPNIESAFIFGSVAKGNERSDSDIDLMVIGNVDSLKLYDILAPLDKELGRSIHLTHYDHDDLKSIEDDIVLKEIFNGPKLMVINYAT